MLDTYCECSKDTSILTLSGLTLKLLCLTLLKDGLPHPESSETETEKIQLPLEFLTCALYLLANILYRRAISMTGLSKTSLLYPQVWSPCTATPSLLSESLFFASLCLSW